MPTVAMHVRTSTSPARRSPEETSPTTVRVAALDSPQPPLNPDEARAAALTAALGEPLEAVHKLSQFLARYIKPCVPRAMPWLLVAAASITVVGAAMTMACGLFARGGGCLPNFYDQVRAAVHILIVFLLGLTAYKVTML